jgi:site-specific recombinase XerD
MIQDRVTRGKGPAGTLHCPAALRYSIPAAHQPDKAIPENVRRYQLRLASIGTTVPTLNAGASALRFFFKVTLKRRDLADAVVSVREPRRLPVVLSPEEVGRLLALTTNIKPKAALSLAYATGLRSSQVVSLKLTDIDSDRIVIRVEQGKGKKDRYVILSPNLLDILRDWWRAARKKGWMSPGQPWLFPGYRGQHMSRRQLHRLVRMAAQLVLNLPFRCEGAKVGNRRVPAGHGWIVISAGVAHTCRSQYPSGIGSVGEKSSFASPAIG